MRALALKAGVTAITMAAAVAAALYVNGHVKNGAAPLHPAVVGRPSVVSTGPGGQLSLTSGVKSSNVETVTSTYAS